MSQSPPPYRSLAMMALMICAAQSPTVESLSQKIPTRRMQKVYDMALNGSQGTNEVPNPDSRRRIINGGTKLQMALLSTIEAPMKSMVTVTSDSRRRSRVKIDSGAGYQRMEMLKHEMLTKSEEFALGQKVQRSNELQAKIADIIDMKKMKPGRQDRFYKKDGPIDESIVLKRVESIYDDGAENIDWHELNLLGAFGLGKGLIEDIDCSDTEYSDDDHVLQEKSHFQNMIQIRQQNREIVDDSMLTDSEITNSLGMTRSELRRILIDGALARDKLVTCNIRLVVSIAKKWSKQSARYTNADSSTRLVSVYNGSGNRPSLDEAIQEGILGLARAAVRYEPDRGLKFSTYATYWVTSYVRSCFQRSVTGCVKIPAPFHDIKSKFKTIVKRCYESGEDLPEEQLLADEIGVTTTRLRNALRFTKPLVSLDARQYFGPSKGSRAGEAGVSDVLLGETIPSEERQPEAAVELSLLRQCLENAMATELSPHERDVVRLRLGLDDGVTRTAQEVVDVCGGTISVHSVRSAEQRAYKKLRSPYAVHTRQLMSYLDFADVDIASINALKLL